MYAACMVCKSASVSAIKTTSSAWAAMPTFVPSISTPLPLDLLNLLYQVVYEKIKQHWREDASLAEAGRHVKPFADMTVNAHAALHIIVNLSHGPLEVAL